MGKMHLQFHPMPIAGQLSGLTLVAAADFVL